MRTVALSLDDFYLSRDARQRLAREVHPLLAVRGPPGTHDVPLAGAVIDQLRSKGKVALPRFDKASDTRSPRATWETVRSPVDVVIFEGWCVGAKAQGHMAAVQPDRILIGPEFVPRAQPSPKVLIVPATAPATPAGLPRGGK